MSSNARSLKDAPPAGTPAGRLAAVLFVVPAFDLLCGSGPLEPTGYMELFFRSAAEHWSQYSPLAALSKACSTPRKHELPQAFRTWGVVMDCCCTCRWAFFMTARESHFRPRPLLHPMPIVPFRHAGGRDRHGGIAGNRRQVFDLGIAGPLAGFA